MRAPLKGIGFPRHYFLTLPFRVSMALKGENLVIITKCKKIDKMNILPRIKKQNYKPLQTNER